jgi:hypothetical protein
MQAENNLWRRQEDQDSWKSESRVPEDMGKVSRYSEYGECVGAMR